VEQWRVRVGVRLVGVVLVGVAGVVAVGVVVGVAGGVAVGVVVGVVVGVAGVVVPPGGAVVCGWVLDATETDVERGGAAAGTDRVADFAATTTPMTAAEANTEEPRRPTCAGELPVTATDIVSGGSWPAGAGEERCAAGAGSCAGSPAPGVRGTRSASCSAGLKSLRAAHPLARVTMSSGTRRKQVAAAARRPRTLLSGRIRGAM
jgi:hypothetical protein